MKSNEKLKSYKNILQMNVSGGDIRRGGKDNNSNLQGRTVLCKEIIFEPES